MSGPGGVQTNKDRGTGNTSQRLLTNVPKPTGARHGGGTPHQKAARSIAFEWVIVVLIIGVLVTMATPHFVEARRSAVAARIVCDFNAISRASMAAYADTQEFPASTEWGRMPVELARYLPRNFTFYSKDAVYRWRCWSLPSGLPKRPDQNHLLGLQVRTKDPRLLNSIVHVYRGRIVQLTDTQVTFVLL